MKYYGKSDGVRFNLDVELSSDIKTPKIIIEHVCSDCFSTFYAFSDELVHHRLVSHGIDPFETRRNLLIAISDAYLKAGIDIMLTPDYFDRSETVH